MDGLLLKFLQDTNVCPGECFWKYFPTIRQDLDRLYWCFAAQPWMGAPGDFREDDVLETFSGCGTTGVQLWRSGSLAKYAETFAEEEIELWGIDSELDDPQDLAARYGESCSEDIIRQHGRIWLIYCDSTCWEIFARDTTLLVRVKEALQGKPCVDVYPTNSENRGPAFSAAGLANIWGYLGGGAP